MVPTHQQKHQAGRHLAVAQALLHGHDAKLAGPTAGPCSSSRRAPRPDYRAAKRQMVRTSQRRHRAPGLGR